MACSIQGCAMSDPVATSSSADLVDVASQSEPHLIPNARAWRRVKRNKPAVAALVFIALVALTVLIWPWIASSPPNALPVSIRSWLPLYPPNAVSDAQFPPPGAQHWFGTDVHGRDLLARTIDGARISLLVGAVGAGVSLIIGVL